MSNLDLFAKNDEQLQSLLNILKQFSDNIRMKFGLDKCVKAAFFLWKVSEGKEHYRNGYSRS